MSTMTPQSPLNRPALNTLALLVGMRVTRGLSTGILVGVILALVVIGSTRPDTVAPFLLPLLMMQIGQMVWARKVRREVRRRFSDLSEDQIKPLLPRVHELDIRGEGLDALQHLRP